MAEEIIKSWMILANRVCQSQAYLVSFWFSNLVVMLLKTRDFLTAQTQNYLGFESAALVTSMVFGGSDQLTPSVRQSFKVIGMQHVMAASGFNVGLVAQLCRGSLQNYCSRRGVALLSLAAIWSYVVMAGATASVVRAGLMLTISIIGGHFLYRQTTGLGILAITMVSMVAMRPAYMEDIGFQLSVTSSLGLILVTPLLEKGSWLRSIETGQPEPPLEEKSAFFRCFGPIKDAFFTTLAAQSLSLPVLWHHFGEISLLSLPANAFLLWMTPIITLGGVAFMGAASLAFLLPPFLKWPLIAGAWCLEKITQIFLVAVQWLGQFSTTLLEIKPLELRYVFGWWAIVFLVVIWRTRGRKHG